MDDTERDTKEDSDAKTSVDKSHLKTLRYIGGAHDTSEHILAGFSPSKWNISIDDLEEQLKLEKSQILIWVWKLARMLTDMQLAKNSI